MEKRLIDVINEYGVENIYFLIKMNPIRTVFGLISYTSSSDPEIPMLCNIDESKYKIIDNYKITLKSIEQIKGIYGREHFYISDLQHMIDIGNVQVFIKAFN